MKIALKIPLLIVKYLMSILIDDVIDDKTIKIVNGCFEIRI